MPLAARQRNAGTAAKATTNPQKRATLTVERVSALR
jgi:hypothetical protein